MNIAKAINAGLLVMTIIGITIPDQIMSYNERVFGISDQTWVSNEFFDPSTLKIFYRGAPAATRWYSSNQLSKWGLYGWYREPKS